MLTARWTSHILASLLNTNHINLTWKITFLILNWKYTYLMQNKCLSLMKERTYMDERIICIILAPFTVNIVCFAKRMKNVELPSGLQTIISKEKIYKEWILSKNYTSISFSNIYLTSMQTVFFFENNGRTNGREVQFMLNVYISSNKPLMTECVVYNAAKFTYIQHKACDFSHQIDRFPLLAACYSSLFSESVYASLLNKQYPKIKGHYNGPPLFSFFTRKQTLNQCIIALYGTDEVSFLAKKKHNNSDDMVSDITIFVGPTKYYTKTEKPSQLTLNLKLLVPFNLTTMQFHTTPAWYLHSTPQIIC